MAGRTTKAKRIIFSFLILIAFGVVPLTIAHNHGVTIHIELIEPHGEIHYGDRIRLKCSVSGTSDPYYLSWQCLRVTGNSEDDSVLTWEDLHCYSDEYEYILTRDNVDYLYRVIVMLKDETYSTSTEVPTTYEPQTDSYPSEKPEVVRTPRVVEEIE